MDVALLRDRLAKRGMGDALVSDDDVLCAYLTRDECSDISPSPFFDERFYRAMYPDMAAFDGRRAGSAFAHFVFYGLEEGRWPCETLFFVARSFAEPLAPIETLDAAKYLELNLSARDFVAAFPVLGAKEHFNRYGRFLHLIVDEPVPVPESDPYAFLTEMEHQFDPIWYADRYLDGDSSPAHHRDPFGHYLSIGVARSYSPNDWFEEEWYRAFYPDVLEALPGDFLCGFHHYLATGRAERRIPKFDLETALENQLPGVTKPELITRATGLRRRFYKDGLRASRRPDLGGPGTVWFLLPHLNPDIAFGGYRACFELMRALRAAGIDVAIYCTQAVNANKTYFLWRQRSESLREAFEDIIVLSRDEDHRIGIGPRDRIVAYTVMDLPMARDLSAWTQFDRPYLLAQEYEPIFFEHSSTRALTDESYDVPHYPIINSAYLHEYFRTHGVGIFGNAQEPIEGRDFAVFEHRINRLPSQTVASMASRNRRVLALYARPEKHAARNLFEMALIALQNLCRAGVFGTEWSFVGLGALSDLDPIELGRGHRLVVYKRTSEEEYIDLVGSLDIGLSLMYAPHPGVVAFEFATTGALVVTNTYENRTAEELRVLCENIVPCEPTLGDLERAILEAVDRVHDYESRVRHTLAPERNEWNEIFSSEFVERVFGADVQAP